MTMAPKKKTVVHTCIVIPAAVANGFISGIIGVITSYFFKPIWNRITDWWNNERKIS